MTAPRHTARAPAPRLAPAAHALALGIVGCFVMFGLGGVAAALAIALALGVGTLGEVAGSRWVPPGAVLGWCAPLAALATLRGADPMVPADACSLASAPLVLPLIGWLSALASDGPWTAIPGGVTRTVARVGAVVGLVAVVAAAITTARHGTLADRLAGTPARPARELARAYAALCCPDDADAVCARDIIEVELESTGDSVRFVSRSFEHDAGWALAFDAHDHTVLVPSRVVLDPVAPPRVASGLAVAGLLVAGLALFGADRARARLERLERADHGVVRDDGLVALDGGVVVRARIEHEPATRVAVERAPERSAYRVDAAPEALATFRVEGERDEAIAAARSREHVLLGWCVVAIVLTIGPLVCAWLTGHAVI